MSKMWDLMINGNYAGTYTQLEAARLYLYWASLGRSVAVIPVNG